MSKLTYKPRDIIYFEEILPLIDSIVGQSVMEATLPIAYPGHPGDDPKPCDDYNARVSMFNGGACLMARKVIEKWHELEEKPDDTES